MNKEADARPRRADGSPSPRYFRLRQGSDGQALFLIPYSSRSRSERGFTLLELIVVVAILSILMVATFFVVDPLQMVARANDTRRLTDLDTLNSAILSAISNGPSTESGGIDLDGINTNTCVGESAQTVYVSVDDGDGAGGCNSAPANLPAGWTYACANPGSVANVNGTGWIPVNFTDGGSVVSPISNLPLDTENTFSSGYYFSYVCTRNRKFELNARMVSTKNRTGGTDDQQSDDGGDDIFVYEVGNDLNLNPRRPAGYWAFNEGSGTTTLDNSGNGHDGNLINQTAWVAGVSGNALTFDGTTDKVNLVGTLTLDPAGFTISNWMKTNSAASQMHSIGNAGGGDGYRFGLTGGKVAFLLGSGGYTANTCGTTLVNDDVWHLITGVYESGSTFTCYIDGSFEASVAVGSYPTMQLNSPDFGTPPCCVDWDGELDEVLIYDRVLSAEEIAYQYNALKP